MTGQTYDRYLTVPRSGSGPGVLVLHAWWGLNDFIRDVCDRLAQAGFVALAPDLFAGKTADTPEAAENLVTHLNEVEVVPPIVFAAVDELINHPAVTGNRLGTVGFSFGGYWALWLASQKPEEIRAVSIFYSTGEGDFHRSKAAFQGHFAETDPFESEEGIRGLEEALKEANRPVTFYHYPGTGHWFFEKDRQEAYHSGAAQLAWDRTIAFLHEHLDGQP